MNSASSGSESPRSELFSPRPVNRVSEEVTEPKCYKVYRGCIKIIFLTAFVCWIIFSVMALVDQPHSDLKEICKDTHIWACLCTMTGIAGLQILLDSIPKENRDASSSSLGICLGIAGYIWMAIELFNSCALKNLSENNIYMMVLILFIVQSFIYLLLICAVCGFICFEVKDKPNNDNGSLTSLNV